MVYWTNSINYNYGTPGFASGGANGYGSTAISATQVALLDSHLGKSQPVININLRMMNSGTLYTWAGAYLAPLNAIHTAGAIPFCTWGLWDLGNRGNNFSLRLSQIAAGAWDSYFNDFFAGAAAWGHPFWVRPYWEWNVRDMWVTNGNFPWCTGNVTDTGHTWVNWAPVLGGTNPADGSTNADHKRAWKHIVDLRNANGAYNVNMVWCPNGMGTSGKTSSLSTGAGPLTDYWPGAPYVDWFGPDLYQTGYGGGSISSGGSTWKSLYEIMTGSSGTGLQNTWQNLINCDESARIPMCIPETNANLNTFVTASDSTGRVGRAAYLKDMFETSIPALPRMGLMSIFYWYSTHDRNAYTWEQYDDGSPSLDAPNSSPDGSGNAVFGLTLPDFVAAKNALGGSLYPDRSQIVLPADLKPIRPYWLEDVLDRYRKGKRNQAGLVGYWRGVDLASPLADDSGNGRTAVAEGTVTYGNTTVVPANPSDGALGIAGGSTSDWTIADNDAFSVTTTGQLFIEFAVLITALPGSGNMHLLAKGASGQFEYSNYVNSTGLATFTVWDLTAANGSAANSAAGAIVAGKRYLFQSTFDNVAKLIHLYISSEDGGAWANVANVSAGYTLTASNGTAPLDIGRRASAGDLSLNGRIGHPSVHNFIPSTTTLQQNYKNWLVAPVISGVTVA